MKRYALALIAIFALSSAARTPPEGPVPAPRPPVAKQETKPADDTAPPADADIPVPQPEPPKPAQTPPENPPAPEQKPAPDADDKKADTPEPEPKPEPEDMAAYRQCLTDLRATGAKFREADPLKAEGQCGIEAPVELTETGDGIRIEPPAITRCETALALSRWSASTLVPSARIALPEKKVASIANASTYICRNRNSAENGKISEHARGNAIDIAAIAFSDGETLVMKPRQEDSDMEGALQRSLTASACLFFTTVLSPGSDEAHEDHLHLDVMKRKDGYRYCR